MIGKENTTPKTEMIEISSILIEGRSRDVDEGWAQALAAMFKASEMLNPITIWQSADGPFLVAGAHRLAAHVINGETHIAASWSKAETVADAKVLEIMENIGRHELTALDRAQHLFDLKQAYEAKYPETKKGGDKQTEQGREKLNGIVPFSTDTAEKTGLSDSSITKAVAMWTGLAPGAISIIKGTWLADHQAGLMAMAKEKPTVQAKALEMMFPTNGKPVRAMNVPDALILATGKLLETTHQKQFAAADRVFNSFSDEDFGALLLSHEARIMAWVEGRIGGVK
ncbi:MAG: hypothetical protein COB39_03455 [Marinosulfonomonas sp.]|nr:MAG: hypothetical protein COB39_03455 [Marinosulfonomonas sp.]